MAVRVVDWSDSDLAAIAEVIRAYRGRVTRRKQPVMFEEDPTAPDIYIARTPSTGIPGMSNGNPGGSGEGSDSGTGFTGTIGG